MKKKLIIGMLLGASAIEANAADYYVSPEGSDNNKGTIESPYATLTPVQSKVKPGDTVYFRGGTYKPTVEQSMGERSSLYSCAFILEKSGEEGSPITYMAYPGEQPVFDMSGYLPEGKRISVFYVNASWLHIRDLEVTGTKVMVNDGSNTQSECFSNRGGSHNIYERLKMHDGEAIGWYLVKGGDNLVLNCDAWCNYDKANGGGNTDGFGCHPAEGDTGNVLRGCRSWWNSDDGFDLIHAFESVWIDNCWAFYNGYCPNEFKSAADGNGIKAGGYGMSETARAPETIPSHKVTNCLAYYNKSGGLYSNHHLAGITWINNTAVYNRWNYNMTNRKSHTEAVDVNGYGHFLANNVSFNPRDKDYYYLDLTLSTLYNNTFGPVEMTLTDSDFVSVDAEQLIAERKSDGSLPDISFMVPSAHSTIADNQMGYTYVAPTVEEVTEAETAKTQWLMAPVIVVENEQAWIEGPGADLLSAFYANGVKLKVSKGKTDLSAAEGSKLKLRALMSNGVVITRTYYKQ